MSNTIVFNAYCISCTCCLYAPPTPVLYYIHSSPYRGDRIKAREGRSSAHTGNITGVKGQGVGSPIACP